MSGAIAFDTQQQTSWSITREGGRIATIEVRPEHGEFVVSAGGASGLRPYRFHSLEAADAFVGDLITSFSYLGCDISQG